MTRHDIPVVALLVAIAALLVLPGIDLLPNSSKTNFLQETQGEPYAVLQRGVMP